MVMKTEVEAKFLNTDHFEVRDRLKAIGAVCDAPMRLMRRAIVDFSDGRLQTGNPNSFVRIRDEGDKVTLTYKRFNTFSIDGAQEIEVEVSSFEDTIAIFTAIGLHVASFQESKRETWSVGRCEVVLDEWPWLSPYIEIEADTEDVVKSVAEQLGFAWKDAVFGDVMTAYREQYPHLSPDQTIGNMPEVRFGAPPPEFFIQ